MKIAKQILEHIPKIKKRSWVFSLIWKVFKILKTINISYKIELKPNNFQRIYFQKASGIYRFVWNWDLGNWNEKYNRYSQR